MDMRQAMEQRHTVRVYLDKPIPEDVVTQIEAHLETVNREFDVEIGLTTDDSSAFNAALKLVLAKGVRNYFILAGQPSPTLRERLGMAGADLMLFCQTLGLNTWWVGGTFSRKAVSQKVPGRSVIGIVAVGYGATQGCPHKTKTPAEVSSYEGEAPAWFNAGVQAALLAPTALNKQAFFIKGRGNTVTATYDPGAFSGEDLGLVKYHFELGAGSENFHWQ